MKEKKKNDHLNYELLRAITLKKEAPKTTNTIIHIICVKSM